MQQRVDTTIPIDVAYHSCLTYSAFIGALYVVGGLNGALSGRTKTVQIHDINNSPWCNGSTLTYNRAWGDRQTLRYCMSSENALMNQPNVATSTTFKAKARKILRLYPQVPDGPG